MIDKQFEIMTDITNQIPLRDIQNSITPQYEGISADLKTCIESYYEPIKPKNEKADFAIELLKRYSKQTGNLLRGTSDLSPLEEWLIIQLHEEKTLPKLSGVVNGTRSKLFQEVLKEAKERNLQLSRKEDFKACNLIGEAGRNIVSQIDK